LKLSDDLRDARNAIEKAMNEEGLRADARVMNAGRNYGLEARLRGEIPQKGDRQPPPEA
jgi:hypothetical protein